MQFSAFMQLLLSAHIVHYNYDHTWEAFKERYNKTYSSQMDEEDRKAIFRENVEEIIRHNLEASMGMHSHKLGITAFADMSFSEFESFLNRLRPWKIQHYHYFIPKESDASLPEHVDWREKGVVTRVKNQGSCGACWAFTVTGALEGAWARRTGQLVPLSEQNLIDCTRDYGNEGCNGGSIHQTFKYIIHNGGVDRENCYFYRQHAHRRCHFRHHCIGATMTNYANIPEGSEYALKVALARIGPVAAAINARPNLQHYREGVYSDDRCTNDVTHGVLVVGYGTTDDGQDYWLIKNSWGHHWGDSGFFKIARNANNMCGISSLASYPII